MSSLAFIAMTFEFASTNLVIELGIILALLMGWQFTLGELIGGSMEGHAAMDMSVTEGGSIWKRMTPPKGFTAISRSFVMDWAGVWKDIFGGLLIDGALAAWVAER